jgi:hypothetical protein
VGRESTFADAKIIELIKTNFIPVAADDWYQRRREDDEGAFFRKVADQGPRKGQGGGTRQGIYAFTASGKLLGYRNHPDPDVMRRFMQDSLAQWNKLPAAERAKGAVEVGDAGKVDSRYARTPPKDGLIVNVFTRILDRGADDGFVHGTCKFPGGNRAAHDRMWLTAEELQALMPKDVKKGQEITIPTAVTYRLARFHLTDNTRGEPPIWSKPQVRSAQIKLVVEAVGDSEVRVKLTGAVLLSTDADPKTAQRGYDVHLLGDVHYNPATRKMTRFDIVALGDHWGSGPFTGGARPGRTPLGVAFELGNPERTADLVPPQAMRESGAYYRAER